jgi:hypothetical protein
MDRLVIGVAGTAKNTGKTTTLMTLINLLKEKKICTVGLTGIGYDGENFDNVTGLPKPRIEVFEGMVVATADKCVKNAKAEIEILSETPIRTPLGRIVLGRVKKAGKVVIAGPVKGSDLRVILDGMAGFAAELIFTDGALGRIAPFTEADGLVLATGASRNSDISSLALETKSLLRLLSISVMKEKGVTARFGSVLTEKNFSVFVNSFTAVDTMIAGGLFNGLFLEAVAGNKALYGKRLLFDNPFKLLLAGETDATCAALEKIEKNVETGVLKLANIIAVTVNPYYPKYRYTTGDYEEAYVDKTALVNAIRDVSPSPCFNAVQTPRELLDEILKYRPSG